MTVKKIASTVDSIPNGTFSSGLASVLSNSEPLCLSGVHKTWLYVYNHGYVPWLYTCFNSSITYTIRKRLTL